MYHNFSFNIYFINFQIVSSGFIFENNDFSENFGIKAGGTIYFTNMIPALNFSANTFTRNLSPYGNDFASYPIRMNLNNLSLSNYSFI